jgi:hypothetical protein
MKKTFILAHDIARQGALDYVRAAPVGYWVTVKPPAKTREMEAKYHAQIDDIADQWMFCGRKWDAEDMKRLCIDQFRRDTIRDPDLAELWVGMGSVDMAPSLDGSGVVALGTQSRRFPKKLASAFIEWLNALGAEHDVRWSDHNRRAA